MGSGMMNGGGFITSAVNGGPGLGFRGLDLGPVIATVYRPKGLDFGRIEFV